METATNNITVLDLLGHNKQMAEAFCKLCGLVRIFKHGTVCVEFRGEEVRRVYVDQMGEVSKPE